MRRPPTSRSRPTTATATFECRVDDAVAWTACSAAVHLTGLGRRRPRAARPRGRPGREHRRRPGPRVAWTVDTRAPSPRSPRGPATRRPRPARALVHLDRGSAPTSSARIDGGAWSCMRVAPKTYRPRRRPHTFDVRATDAAGNTDPSPASSVDDRHDRAEHRPPARGHAERPDAPTPPRASPSRRPRRRRSSATSTPARGRRARPAPRVPGLADGSHTSSPRQATPPATGPDAVNLRVDHRHGRPNTPTRRRPEDPYEPQRRPASPSPSEPGRPSSAASTAAPGPRAARR